MNTDNTSICGITLDYGPSAFMDNYRKDKVFSSIDRNGRYRYSNQHQIALWNMSALASALYELIKEELDLSEDELKVRFIKEFNELEKFSKQLT